MGEWFPSKSVALLDHREIVPWQQLQGDRAPPLMADPPYLPARAFYHPHFQWKRHPSIALGIITVPDALLCVGRGDSGMVVLRSGECVREQSFFANSFRQGGPLQPVSGEPILDAAYVAFDARWFNYYHLLCCALPRLQMAKDALQTDVPVVLPKYEVLELEPKPVSKETYERIVSAIELKHQVIFLNEGVYRVEKLMFTSTIPEKLTYADADLQNLESDRTPFGLPNIASLFTDVAELEPFYDIFDKIKKRVLKGHEPEGMGKAIYLDRRDSRVPPYLQALLDEALPRLDIARIVLEDHSFESQVAAVAGARRIISPHGAGLTNLLFSEPGTDIVEFLPKFPSELVYRPFFYQLASGRRQPYRAVDPSKSDLIADQLDSILCG